MGCCHSSTHASTAEEQQVVAPDGAPQSQQQSQPRGARERLSTPGGIRQQYRSAGATARPNVPIRPSSPVPRSPRGVSRMHPPWTRSHLESERRAFFDTRVGQQRHHWEALDTICDMIRHGQLVEAQAILDADNLTVPNGRIARGRSRSVRDREGHRIRGGVYDERGLLYEIPEWCLGDPEDLVEDVGGAGGEVQQQPKRTVLHDEDGGVALVEKDMEVGGGASSDGTHDDYSYSDSDGGQSSTAPTAAPARQKPPREEKGKGRAEDVGERFAVKVRFSNTQRDAQILLGARQTVRFLAQQLRELTSPESDPETHVQRIRLMYQGRELDQDRTLEAQGFARGHVVNAFVFEDGIG